MNNSNTVLSIIVPIYNVEDYLKACLDSILAQEFNFKVEVILVNDGATDKSKIIAAEYCENNTDSFFYFEQLQHLHKPSKKKGNLTTNVQNKSKKFKNTEFG